MVCTDAEAILMIVGQHALQTGASVADEHWEGTEEEELSCFVSEVSQSNSYIDGADLLALLYP